MKKLVSVFAVLLGAAALYGDPGRGDYHRHYDHHHRYDDRDYSWRCGLWPLLGVEYTSRDGCYERCRTHLFSGRVTCDWYCPRYW